MMNILLLTFSAEGMYLEYCAYALGCLKAYLLKDNELRARCAVSIKYYNGSSPPVVIGEYKKEILNFILEKDMAAVGLGCYIWNTGLLLSLVPEIKKLRPEVRIILGGPQVMHNPEEILRENPSVDVIVRGDGEAALLDIISHYIYSDGDLEEIEGISYRKEGRIASTPHRAPLPLEKIPSPYLEGLINVKTGYVYPVEGSRGCLFRCAYCHWGMSRLSYFPIEKVKREIKYLIECGITIGMFVDSAVNFHRERAQELIDFINEHSRGMMFTMFFSLHHLTMELIEILNRSPVIYVEIGIQSLNPVALKNINRKMVKKEALDLLKHVKNPFTIDLIYGLPGDTLETFAHTFQEIFKYTHIIHIFKLGVHPGTRIWKKRQEYLIETDGEYSGIVSNYTYCREDMEKTTAFKKNYEEIFSPVICGEFTKEEILKMADQKNIPLFELVNNYSEHLRKSLSDHELAKFKLSSGETKRSSLEEFLALKNRKKTPGTATIF